MRRKSSKNKNMEKSQLTILLIVAGLVLFVIGGGIGIFYQKQITASQIKIAAAETLKAQKVESAVNFLSSKLVTYISATGQVVGVKGRDITLNSGGDTILVHIKDNAPISAPAYDSTMPSIAAAPGGPQIEIENIKTGDSLNVQIKVLPDGQLEGQAIMIIPVINIAPIKK
jgi:hypothetical protein